MNHEKNINRTNMSMRVETLSAKELFNVMFAGAAAGAVEHGTMFPIDTIKTRMQTSKAFGGSEYRNVFQGLRSVVQQEGFFRLYKGCSAIILAAIPSHAVYFSVYESTRVFLNINRNEHNFFKTMLAGSAATLAHDFLVTPLDVVKQRMQLQNSKYLNPIDAAKCVCRDSGLAAFIRSYPTTVLLNVPYMSTQFAVYESVKLYLRDTFLEEESSLHHLVAGGVAGGLAGFISCPLDVIKTTIQTDPRCGFRKIRSVSGEILLREGYKGFFRGATARAIYCVPSASLIWMTYDGLRIHFGIDIDEEYVA